MNLMTRVRNSAFVGGLALAAACTEGVPTTQYTTGSPAVNATYEAPGPCRELVSAELRAEAGHGYFGDQLSLTCKDSTGALTAYLLEDGEWRSATVLPKRLER